VTFPGVRGHEQVISRLARAAANDSPHHAYIFHGPDGVGRRQVALGFARALNCEHPPSTGSFCGDCGPCRRVAEGTDADAWTIAPHPPSGRESPLAIRVDDIRELQGRLAYRANEGRTRVVVLDDCELMNTQAANCLLKTLEEPPPRTVLVLITQRPGQLLPTVRSRCLQIGFQRLSAEVVREHLAEDLGVESDLAALLAASCGGSIGRAICLSAEEAGQEVELLGRFCAALRGGVSERLELAAEFDRLETEARRSQGSFMRRFVVAAGEVLRDAAAQATGAGARRSDCSELAQALASSYDADALLHLFDELQRVRDRLDRNMNTRLVMEALLLNE